MSKELNQVNPAERESDRLSRSQSHDLDNLEKAENDDVQRSLVRSVFIVIICTAAMVVNVCHFPHHFFGAPPDLSWQISNSTSVAISLPTIEKRLDIQQDQLQWLVSAYSLSSVRTCFTLVCYVIRLTWRSGLPSLILWQIGRSLWTEKGVYDRYSGPSCLFSWLWLRSKWVCSKLCRSSPFIYTVTDGLTLAVLRGFQGIGGAATIPSAVSIFTLATLSTGRSHPLAQLGILAHAFPPARGRSLAFATFAAGAPVGAAFGTIIGGVLTQLTSCVIIGSRVMQHFSSVFI